MIEVTPFYLGAFFFILGGLVSLSLMRFFDWFFTRPWQDDK